MFKTYIIIDDPFLKASYGFLDFCKLLDLMDKHNFHTTIAFIPWNYRRTNKKTAKLFLDRPDRFSCAFTAATIQEGNLVLRMRSPLRQFPNWPCIECQSIREVRESPLLQSWYSLRAFFQVWPLISCIE